MLEANQSSGIFLAARVSAGGCETMYSNGIYVCVLSKEKAIVITGNFSK